MDNTSRRDFIRAASAMAAVAALPLDAKKRLEQLAPPLEEHSVAELTSMMARGEITSQSLTQQYLDRIASMDHQGPSLHAVIETNPDALNIAASLDAERKAGKVREPAAIATLAPALRV